MARLQGAHLYEKPLLCNASKWCSRQALTRDSSTMHTPSRTAIHGASQVQGSRHYVSSLCMSSSPQVNLLGGPWCHFPCCLAEARQRIHRTLPAFMSTSGPGKGSGDRHENVLQEESMDPNLACLSVMDCAAVCMQTA
jgi:hypothetical protein